MDDFKERLFFQLRHSLFIRVFAKLRGDKGDIEYVKRTQVDREIENAIRNAKQDEINNIKEAVEPIRKLYDIRWGFCHDCVEFRKVIKKTLQNLKIMKEK